MAENNCKTCKYRESGDDAYHCYMFKVEPTDLCMQHQDRKPKRIGTIGHVGAGKATLTAAIAVILARAGAETTDGVPRLDGEVKRPSDADGKDTPA